MPGRDARLPGFYAISPLASLLQEQIAEATSTLRCRGTVPHCQHNCKNADA